VRAAFYDIPFLIPQLPPSRLRISHLQHPPCESLNKVPSPPPPLLSLPLLLLSSYKLYVRGFKEKFFFRPCPPIVIVRSALNLLLSCFFLPCCRRQLSLRSYWCPTPLSPKSSVEVPSLFPLSTFTFVFNHLEF